MAQIIDSKLFMSHETVELIFVDPDLIFELVKTNKLSKRDFNIWLDCVKNESYENGLDDNDQE
jgi:hypothetical protein